MDERDLNDPRAWWDAGYNRGIDGIPLAAALDHFRRLVGVIADWQYGPLVAGHALGCQDRVTFLADMADRRRREPVATPAPF